MPLDMRGWSVSFRTDSGVKEHTEKQLVAGRAVSRQRGAACAVSDFRKLSFRDMTPPTIESGFSCFIFSCPFYFIIFSSVSHILSFWRDIFEFTVRLPSCVVWGKLSPPL